MEETATGEAAVRIDPLPFPLRWYGTPGECVADGDRVTLHAGPGTDLFADPAGDPPVLTAPFLAGAPEDDFALSARVAPTLSATFDAGVLVLWAHEECWAKLCVELSPQGEPTVVSVVTRGVADDANAFTTDPDRTWLRVSRIGSAFAFHASGDGELWSLVRYFALDPGVHVVAGLLAQSPTGNVCAVTFDEIRLARPPADIRSGQ